LVGPALHGAAYPCDRAAPGSAIRLRVAGAYRRPGGLSTDQAAMRC